jgi:hypothetical protein
MKSDEGGDAMGRPRWRSSFLGDPGAKFLVEKRAQVENQAARRGRSGEPHSFLAEGFQSGPERSRARRWRERSGPWTARTALRKFPREGMAPFPFATLADRYQPIGVQS